MTIGRTESVLGMPDTQWGAQPGNPISEITDKPNNSPAAGDAQSVSEVQWVNTELHAIASTIEELQGRLEQANSRLGNVEEVEAKEVEIGRLFIEAQRFIDAYLSKIEVKIHEVMSEAEAKARQILFEATEEAQAIRGEAQQAAFASTSTVHELQSAIAGFTTVNAELLKELGTLNSMLSPGSSPASAETEAALPPEVHSTGSS